VEIFWIVVTVVVVLAIAAAWILVTVRGQLVWRSEKAAPEDAEALRELQRQIDAGHSHTSRGGFSGFP
jgi:hypothetical protein